MYLFTLCLQIGFLGMGEWRNGEEREQIKNSLWKRTKSKPIQLCSSVQAYTSLKETAFRSLREPQTWRENLERMNLSLSEAKYPLNRSSEGGSENFSY